MHSSIGIWWSDTGSAFERLSVPRVSARQPLVTRTLRKYSYPEARKRDPGGACLVSLAERETGDTINPRRRRDVGNADIIENVENVENVGTRRRIRAPHVGGKLRRVARAPGAT